MRFDHSIPVQCSPEKLWRTFMQVENWPAWCKLVKNASWVEGTPWTAGSKFLIEITQPQFKLKAEAAEVAGPHTFTWKGSVMGITIDHHFHFDPQPDGSTLAKSWMELSGPAVFFVNDEMKQKGVARFAEFMAGIKQQAESD
jgi:hypothetical protein